MRALSLWQPWAQLVAIGAKQFETRSWRTNYRGLLAIHATKLMPQDAIDLSLSEPFYSALGQAGHDAINGPARGAIIAVVDLTGCLVADNHWVDELTDQERAFGDFSEGRYGWLLKNVRALVTPVPCAGHQGLWNVPPDVRVQISRQLPARVGAGV